MRINMLPYQLKLKEIRIIERKSFERSQIYVIRNLLNGVYIILYINMFISKGIIFWLVVSSIIVYFDAFYIIMRPQTLPGGKYYFIFKPYELYVQFDKLYGMNNDSFVFIQAWLNVIESTLMLIGVSIAISSCRVKQIAGALLCLITSTMVFWKTVIFVWYDRDWLTAQALSYSPESILCYYLPSYCWIIFPFLSIVNIAKRIVKTQTGDKKNKTD